MRIGQIASSKKSHVSLTWWWQPRGLTGGLKVEKKCSHWGKKTVDSGLWKHGCAVQFNANERKTYISFPPILDLFLQFLASISVEDNNILITNLKVQFWGSGDIFVYDVFDRLCSCVCCPVGLQWSDVAAFPDLQEVVLQVKHYHSQKEWGPRLCK